MKQGAAEFTVESIVFCGIRSLLLPTTAKLLAYFPLITIGICVLATFLLKKELLAMMENVPQKKGGLLSGLLILSIVTAASEVGTIVMVKQTFPVDFAAKMGSLGIILLAASILLFFFAKEKKKAEAVQTEDAAV